MILNRIHLLLLSADRIGIDSAVGLDVGFTSPAIPTRGFSQFSFSYQFIHSAATELFVQFQKASAEGGPWHDIPASRISGGVATQNDLIYKRDVSGNVAKTIDMPINASFIRVLISGTSAHPTNDQISADIELKAGG